MSKESWIKSDADFGMPMIALHVSMRDALCDKEIKEAMQAVAREKPERGVIILERLVAFLRPELSGGSIVAVESRASEQGWKLIYTHPSLARTQAWEMLPEFSLRRAENEADTPVLMESQS